MGVPENGRDLVRSSYDAIAGRYADEPSRAGFSLVGRAGREPRPGLGHPRRRGYLLARRD